MNATAVALLGPVYCSWLAAAYCSSLTGGSCRYHRLTFSESTEELALSVSKRRPPTPSIHWHAHSAKLLPKPCLSPLVPFTSRIDV